MSKFPLRSQHLVNLADKKILILDGALGTMVQSLHLAEESFRGTRFAGHTHNLKGCNDILCITRPEDIAGIHRQYLEAGADIIETNSFNANAISLEDYGLAGYAAEINIKAAKIARRTVDEYCKETGRQAFVAGSIGPTNKSLTMAVTLGDNINWDTMTDAYLTQIKALVAGGVDLLIIETIFDTLNAKAAIYAAQSVFEETGITLPIILSATLTESGRTLSGQSLEAFAATVAHANPFAVGLNCGFGIEDMMPHIAALQKLAGRVSVYANAGLPDKLGRYNETPQMMADAMRPLFQSGRINIAGGCCGTTPAHIRAIAAEAATCAPRKYYKVPDVLTVAGLEPLAISKETNFVNVGERCNVAGSRKFLRLIKEGNYDEALDIARAQADKGAQIIDVNMDDALLDAPQCISHFLRLAQVDPDIAKAPVMVDSSNWGAVIAGLKVIQGKPIVNSISLKEGEKKFVERAKEIHRYGAAMVVMAFDENGQATTFERRIEICARSYRLLTTEAGIPPHDIIFDPNILAIATGIPEHNSYAVDFINATKWIKSNLPGAKVSGGLSNLSFSFRGNNTVREAMHAIFLSHAIPAGMDMAIVNAAALPSPDDIAPRLASLAEDLILNRHTDATDRLIEEAQHILEQKNDKKDDTPAAASENVMAPSERLAANVVKGITNGMENIINEVLAETGSAVGVINGPLMDAMNLVGRRFGEGKMFLPQVVKSASAMKTAVDILTPAIEAEKATDSDSRSSRPRMLIATVKGDVHDIGKNIVSVIMRCNGFDVIDLGVMAPAETIVDTAIKENVDIVGLSGLITPSLEEMCNVARLMQSAGMTAPLFIGGATTSDLHTALKIAPLYSGPVVHTHDAAQMPGIVKSFINPETRADAVSRLYNAQQALRDTVENTPRLLPIEQARALRPDIQYPDRSGIHPGRYYYEWTIDQLAPLINYRAFLAAWKLDASFASNSNIAGCNCHNNAPTAQSQAKAVEAQRLLNDARAALQHLASENVTVKSVVDLLPASSNANDEIVIATDKGKLILPTLRQQADANGEPRLSLSDFISPDNDYIGLFAVTTSPLLKQITEQAGGKDEYTSMLYQTLADRLAEAATEATHRKSLHDWGYAGGVNLADKDAPLHSIRPAVGYPSLHDQSLMFLLDDILNFAGIGLQTTESGALNPASSTAGLIILNPQSRYFILGKIGDDQRQDYLHRHPLHLPGQPRFLPQ